MTNLVTHFANAFEAELSSEVGPSALVYNVDSTNGGPASPAYLVFEADSDAQREIVLADGSFDGTTFRSTDLSNRYLAGSAAASGLTHPAGTRVMVVPVAQMWEDLHDRISQHSHTGGDDGPVIDIGDVAGHNLALHVALGLLDESAHDSDDHGLRHARKSADQSISNQISPKVDDADLVLPLEANSTYLLEGFVWFRTPGATGASWGFSVPGDAELAWSSGGATWGENVDVAGQYESTSTGWPGRNVGGYVTTGPSSGDLQLQWSQVNSEPSPLTLKKGSWIALRKVA